MQRMFACTKKRWFSYTLALCIFSRMKSTGKAFLTIILLSLFAVAFRFSFLMGQFDKLKHYAGEEAAQHYAAVEAQDTLMPSLSEIGQPIRIEYAHVRSGAMIFVWDTHYLICQYEPEEYALQKEQLEEKYIFPTDTLHNNHFSCESTAEINGYQFRVLSINGEYDRYISCPKRRF